MILAALVKNDQMGEHYVIFEAETLGEAAIILSDHDMVVQHGEIGDLREYLAPDRQFFSL